jgi:hypothetical protein
MIVKISSGPGWRYFDGIADVEIYQDNYANAKINNTPTEYMLEGFPKLDKPDKEIFVHILKLYKDGNLYRIIVIGVNFAYLLNDEGKTIERIN